MVEAEEDVFLIGRLAASELAVFGLLLLPGATEAEAVTAAARRGREAAIDDEAGEPLPLPLPLPLLSAPVKKEGEEPKGLPLLVSWQLGLYPGCCCCC